MAQVLVNSIEWDCEDVFMTDVHINADHIVTFYDFAKMHSVSFVNDKENGARPLTVIRGELYGERVKHPQLRSNKPEKYWKLMGKAVRDAYETWLAKQLLKEDDEDDMYLQELEVDALIKE